MIRGCCIYGSSLLNAHTNTTTNITTNTNTNTSTTTSTNSNTNTNIKTLPKYHSELQKHYNDVFCDNCM